MSYVNHDRDGTKAMLNVYGDNIVKHLYAEVQSVTAILMSNLALCLPVEVLSPIDCLSLSLPPSLPLCLLWTYSFWCHLPSTRSTLTVKLLWTNVMLFSYPPPNSVSQGLKNPDSESALTLKQRFATQAAADQAKVNDISRDDERMNSYTYVFRDFAHHTWFHICTLPLQHPNSQP